MEEESSVETHLAPESTPHCLKCADGLSPERLGVKVSGLVKVSHTKNALQPTVPATLRLGRHREAVEVGI